MVKTKNKNLQSISPRFLVTLVASLLCFCATGWGESEQLVSILATSAYKKVAKSVKSGLTSYPSSSSLTKSSSTSSSSLSSSGYDVGISSVSGTPPTLPEIADLSTIKELFWVPGVVDAIATNTSSPNQCMQFFSSNMDGKSGGFGACNLAEGVGHAFETVLHSETSLCFMKNMPTKQNLNAGGVTVVSGDVNADNIAELFKPKPISSKLIKVNTPEIQGKGQAEAIFIYIPSKTENKQEDYLYQAEIYFCAEGQSTARGYNLIHAFRQGGKAMLEVTNANASDPFGGGSHIVTVSGALKKKSGDLIWDRGEDREVSVQFAVNSNAFKSQFTIKNGNRIELKRRADFLDPLNNQIEDKGYSITNFTASDIFDVRFIEGGFKAQKGFGMNNKAFSGATEYRSTYYASAPDNPLRDEVDAYDMDSDSFYDNAANVVVDTSGYSCSATPDIELTMVDNETLEQSLQPCFNDTFRNMQFCKNDPDVNLALQNFPSSCPVIP